MIGRLEKDMVEYKQETDKLICVFKGRMDTITAMKLESDLDLAVRSAKKPVVFDLAGVDYVSSSFMRLCLSVARVVGNGNFSIIHATDFIKNIMRVAGLESFLS